MRRRISESNIFPTFNLFEEYRKIEYLISENQIIGTYNQFGKPLCSQFTIEAYVNQLYFTNWNLRGSFLSTDEMRAGLGIAKGNFNKQGISENMVLDFCQYAANINMRAIMTIEKCPVAYIPNTSYFKTVVDNISLLLDRLGAHFLTDSKTREVCIAYNDELSLVVGVDFPEIESSLAEYLKIDNRSDLKRKGEILCTLFKKLEAEESKFKGTTYKNICDDTMFLFNKIGARHWVVKDKLASKTFMAMSPEELELWYDRTYDMFLSCMVISRYLAIKKDIDAIKRTE